MKRILRLVLKSFCFFALLLLSGTAMVAQTSTSATVTGLVTDSSGAKIPDATVTFTNTATGASTFAKTTSEGSYRLPGLLPGPYRSAATLAGFKTVIREGIDLHVEDQVSIDYTLSVGEVTETVTVSTAGALLETQSPTVSQVIEGRQVLDTPLNGRNVMNLVTLTPGVIAQGSSSGNTSNNQNGGGFTSPFGLNNYQIAGGLSGQSSVYVDGAPLNLSLGHTLPLVLPQDVIQEFRVETSVVNPQYGEFGGGIVNFATKSGGAALHGTIYEYIRNKAFNANAFFNKQTIVNGAPVGRPEFTQNQFGATAGGPIKKDKVFFFGSYEGFRVALGVPNVGRVPTPAELNGDFTADPAIYDPSTQTVIPGTGICGPGNFPCTPGGSGTYIPGTGVYTSEKQFSCAGVANVICPNRIDPTSFAAGHSIGYFPTPNVTSNNPAINYSQNAKGSGTTTNYTLRVDARLGSKQNFFARYSRYDGEQPRTQYLFGTAGPNSTPENTTHAQQYVLGDTIVLDSKSVLDLRASYLRNLNHIIPQQGANLSQFGSTFGAIASQIQYTEFPAIIIPNLISQPYNLLNPTTLSSSDNYVLSGTYTRTLGRHSVSLGAEARRRENYFGFSVSSSGLFVFAGTSTACIPYVGATTCQNSTGTAPNAPTLPGGGATPIADFVTGVITAAPLGFQEGPPRSAIDYYSGIFVNDSWQVSSTLSITAGLRYELPNGNVNKQDRNTVLLPQLSNPLVLVNTAAYPGRSDSQSHRTLFSPRVGLALQPRAGTSVRAGYSLAFLPENTQYSASVFSSPINSPITFVVPGSPLSNPLRGAPNSPQVPMLLQPIGRDYATKPTYFFGQTITSRIANSPFPYLQQWNTNLQQTLSSNSVLQLAYLGARGNHLPGASIDINQLADQFDAAPSQAQRPYPMYQNVNAQSPNVGDSYYHSLQVTASKRFSGGGTLLANYSWAKFLSNTEATVAQVESHSVGQVQDFTNLRAEKSYLSFDVPHRFVFSYILDLPFGKGKHFLAHSSDLVQDLVGGWNATGINIFQSGFPLAIIATNNNLTNFYGAGQIRPNVVGGCSKQIGSIGSQARAGKPVLNAACFKAPGPNAFGNEPRTDGALRGAGIDNWDFSVGKTTPLRETVNLVFRAEAFNLANRTQFGDPNVTSSSSVFGVITSQQNQPRLLQFSLRLNY